MPDRAAADAGEDEPYFRIHVFCCTNRRPAGHARGSCAEAGAEPLRAYLKARVKELGLPGVRINSAGCLDRCELGPVMVVYPQGVWYRYRSYEDVDRILTHHLAGGAPVSDLMLHPSDGPVMAG